MSVLIDWADLAVALESHDDVTIRPGTHHVLATTTITGKAFTLRLAPGAWVTADQAMTALLQLNDCRAVIEAPELSDTVSVTGIIDGNNHAQRGISAYMGSLIVRGGEYRQFVGTTNFVAALFMTAGDRLSVCDAYVHRCQAPGDGVLGNAQGAARGIYAYQTYSVEIRRNRVELIGGEEGDSIHVGGNCVHADVQSNRISGFTRRGIKVQSPARVDGNTVDQGFMGVAVHAGIDAMTGKGCVIECNTVMAPDAVRGILSSGEGARICDNIVTVGTRRGSEWYPGNDQRGIVVEGNGTTVERNNVEGGVRAIDLFCSGVKAHNNVAAGYLDDGILAGHWSGGSTGHVLTDNWMSVKLRSLCYSIAAWNGATTEVGACSGNTVIA